MKFYKQELGLPVRNVDEECMIPLHKRHGDLLPNSIRCIICGPSNCGKTNAMLSLLTESNGLRFENVYVYSKSLMQPKYQLLQTILGGVEDLGYFAYQDGENVIPPCDAKPNSIFIFDDVACNSQSTMRNYFCMGRHQAVDSFYLCQTYAHIPKHLIRDNANFIVLFKQDDMNLKHVYDDHVNTDMPYAKFKDLCAECWNRDKHGFVVIDKDSDVGRYRKGFDCFIKWNK